MEQMKNQPPPGAPEFVKSLGAIAKKRHSDFIESGDYLKPH